MSSKPRSSGVIGDLIESFLDDNEDDLSYNMFQELEKLGDEIERVEENYNTEISELRAEIDGLKEKISELENRLEEE